MSKALSAKSSGLDFSDLDKPDSGESTPPVVRARSGVAAVERSVGVHQKLQEAQDRLKQFEDAKLVEKLDPKLLKESRWANRSQYAFEGKEFADLKEEIRQAGGNVQPVKVRRNGGSYEIVYGHRRSRACLELGFLVNAVVDDVPDEQAFIEMHRENSQREDLSPWEQGMMYRDGLEKGLFPSQRRMADALGVNPGNLNTAVKLAELPTAVVEAFSSPLDLQFRWAGPLHEALKSDPEGVLKRAREIRAVERRPPARAVFEALLGRTVGGAPSPSTVLKIGRKAAGTLTRDAKDAVTLKLSPGMLPPEREVMLLDFLKKLINQE